MLLIEIFFKHSLECQTNIDNFLDKITIYEKLWCPGDLLIDVAVEKRK